MNLIVSDGGRPQGSGAAMTAAFRERLDPSSNSLNALRLLLALVVILSHSWTLGGYGREPTIGGETAGTWAVFGFFVVSGYLITGSRLRSDFGDYLQRRLVRIYPGFLVCLVVTAFVFAPIGYWTANHTLHGFAMTAGSPINYILSNITLKMNTYAIAGTPIHTPYPGAWDGSLWSLYYEFICYLVIGVAGGWALFRRGPTVVAAMFIVASLGEFQVQRVMRYAQNGDLVFILELAPFFLAGSLLYMVRDRIPCRAIIALASCAVIGIILLLNSRQLVVFCALPLSYLFLWLGVTLPLRRVGNRNDISYGVYIYGFPVSQLLAVLRVNRHGQFIDVALTMLLTIPLAAASWLIVERPAMRSARRRPAQQAGIQPPLPTKPRPAAAAPR